MPAKYVVVYILVFAAGIIFGMLAKRLTDESKATIKAGFILIKKDDEVIDGQVRLTKDLWDISENQEVILKVKILPGEPGDWEENKNG